MKRFLFLLLIFCFQGLAAQKYNSALISVYVHKDLNEKSGKNYPELLELAHDPSFDLSFLADSLADFLTSGFLDSFPFSVLKKEYVIGDDHYKEYESHYFEKEDNEPVSVATGYKMFVLEQTEYHKHDADELFSVFPQINTFLTASLKFHLVKNTVDKNVVEIKPDFMLHFWDYKKEDTHIFHKSAIYISELHDWDPITDHPNTDILLFELHKALNFLLSKLSSNKDKFIQKVEHKLHMEKD